MTQPPPALTPMAQFTPEHWANVPREMTKLKLVRYSEDITEGEVPHVEFVFDNQSAFMRRRDELDDDVFAKLANVRTVFVQTIRNELVTGLFVPEVGWLFKMTDEQLAEYAKGLSSALHRQRQAAEGEMVAFLAGALEQGVIEQGVTTCGEIDFMELSRMAVAALRAGGPRSSANAR